MEEILSKLNQIYQKQELCAQLLDNYIWENFLVMRAKSEGRVISGSKIALCWLRKLSMLAATGLDKFTSTRQIFRVIVKNQSQCACLIEKKLKTIIFILCYLNRACSFHFYCNSINKFCIETFGVLILFECQNYDASQRIFFFFQTHLSRGIEKNMLKAWNFITYKFCHRSFDNNLKKNFRTNILESNTTQILLIVVSMVGLCLDI